MSEGLNVIGQPMCRHLLSKGMFVSARSTRRKTTDT